MLKIRYLCDDLNQLIYTNEIKIYICGTIRVRTR